ncbi:hypothetical protein [Streptosporangium roseum]|uniref:hypothetical protein n=1 Tax=Streptosporangium roseum TaxID=2001 RepID=UPI0004CCF9A1|nr:hypothetical protein [Streptosporangium roseum]
MDERLTDDAAAGRELARRLPWWTVWYGEHTRRFWAVPKVGRLSAAPHIEAVSAEELECAARHIERVLAERRTALYAGPPIGQRRPFEEDARGRPPGAGASPAGHTVWTRTSQ